MSGRGHLAKATWSGHSTLSLGVSFREWALNSYESEKYLIGIDYSRNQLYIKIVHNYANIQ